MTAEGVEERELDRNERAALERGSAELRCRQEELVVAPLGAGGVRVEGCGQYATYTCALNAAGTWMQRTTCALNERGALGSAPTVAAPAGSAVVPSAPAPIPADEAAARAAIEQRAPSILACVDAPALALEVSWSDQGALDVRLRGERQGTPEEGCVRAIVRGLSLPSPSASGAIIHAIQR